MSPMPNGWSVDVDGTRVVIRLSGRPDDLHRLTVQEACWLRNQLQLAYLIAAQNGGSDEMQSPVDRVTDLEGFSLAEPRQTSDMRASDMITLRFMSDREDLLLSPQEAIATGLALLRAGNFDGLVVRERRLWVELPGDAAEERDS